MKKVLVLVLVIALLVLTFSPVFAGGGQVQGEKGQGATEEHGCTEQPCFPDNADQPMYKKRP
jgi:hypothetical protein